MAHFNQTSFNNFVLDNNIIGFFAEPITLKSGRKSSFYVNWRVGAEDVFLIDQLSDYVIAFVKDMIEAGKIPQYPETFFGVPEGATKLGVLVQYKWAKAAANFGKGSHVLAMGRGKMPKDHGAKRDREFVGIPRGATVVLEDVTTTGMSLLETIDKLIEADVPVIAAMGLTDRMERRDDGRSVPQAISEKIVNGISIPYLSLSQATTLLPEAALRAKPAAAILDSVRQEFADVGVAPLDI